MKIASGRIWKHSGGKKETDLTQRSLRKRVEDSEKPKSTAPSDSLRACRNGCATKIRAAKDRTIGDGECEE